MEQNLPVGVTWIDILEKGDIAAARDTGFPPVAIRRGKRDWPAWRLVVALENLFSRDAEHQRSGACPCQRAPLRWRSASRPNKHHVARFPDRAATTGTRFALFP